MNIACRRQCISRRRAVASLSKWRAALAQIDKDPANVIYDIKRVLGRELSPEEMSEFNSKHGFQLVGAPSRKDGSIAPKVWVPKFIPFLSFLPSPILSFCHF